eukprot:s3595_g8.t1
MGLIGYDINKAANRICSRRWPHALLGGDARTITEAVVLEWMLKFPQVQQIHLWAGFPCVDLSAVRHGRLNLQGPQSGLFSEVLRVLKLLRRRFGRKFCIRFFVENVASMDKEAAEEISGLLGVRPYRLQSSDASPISPPVLLDRFRTPSSPWFCDAGLARCDEDTVGRWEADSFAYPPYQYKSQYILWKGDKLRLLSAQERELLHGYGFDHTALALPASEIKRNPQEYENLRCSLIGDSFSMYLCMWGVQGALPPHDL